MADLLAGLKGIIEDQVAAPVLGGGIFAEDVDLEDRPLGQSLKREKSLISLQYVSFFSLFSFFLFFLPLYFFFSIFFAFNVDFDHLPQIVFGACDSAAHCE